MKKIIVSAVVTPNDDSITARNIEDAFRHMGSAYFTFTAEVELDGIEGLTKEAWLYISSDDSEPYVQVSASGETKGEELSDEEVNQMRLVGVCAEFYAQYPRAERYGAPAYAGDDDFAAGVVGSHQFKVNVDGLAVYTEDRGDDGCEQIWLKIVLPE
jgi:hypothetical protein